jgi:hypothetical protein
MARTHPALAIPDGAALVKGWGVVTIIINGPLANDVLTIGIIPEKGAMDMLVQDNVDGIIDGSLDSCVTAELLMESGCSG